MLRDRAVLITAIISGAVVALGFLLIIGWMLYTGHDPAALVASIIGLVNGVVLIFMYAKVGRVEQHVNGNTTKLLDAALASPPVQHQEPAP